MKQEGKWTHETTMARATDRTALPSTFSSGPVCPAKQISCARIGNGWAGLATRAGISTWPELQMPGSDEKARLKSCRRKSYYMKKLGSARLLFLRIDDQISRVM
jgi:hypothetical protein